MVTLGEKLALISIVIEKFPQLSAILKRIGINPSKLEFIGSGEHGSVYRHGNKAIKLTDDAQEAKAAWIISESGQLPGINPVYYVAEIPATIGYVAPDDEWMRSSEEFINRPFYIIISNYALWPLSAGEARIVDRISDILVGDPHKSPGKMFKAAITEIPKQYSSLVYRICFSIYNLLDKTGVKIVDIGGDNIMRNTDGYLVFVDLSMAETPPITVPIAV